MGQKKFTRFVGCAMKSIGPILKTEMLIHHSKANLDEKILFGEMTKSLRPNNSKNVCKELAWEPRTSRSILVHDLCGIEV